MGRHHLAGGRNSLRRLQNERLHSPPQTLRLQRNLTPAFVEAADRAGLFFSSQRTLRLSVPCVKILFLFSIFKFLCSIPFLISSLRSLPATQTHTTPESSTPAATSSPPACSPH